MIRKIQSDHYTTAYGVRHSPTVVKCRAFALLESWTVGVSPIRRSLDIIKIRTRATEDDNSAEP